MDNSQRPLATESFSYSWLTDQKPPIPTSSDENEHNFKFDVPVTRTSQASLVHADEIFSDGHLIPVYADTSKLVSFNAPTTIPASPVLLSRTSFRWRKSSKRILNKCFRFACKTIGFSRKSNRVDDIERKVFEVQTGNVSLDASPRPSSAHSIIDWDDVMGIGSSSDLCHGLRRICSWRSSLHASPNISPCRPSDAAENSIHEAIL